ncbi:MAG TPA: SDR family oxidoreductase [Thermoanaerobaculia bacterium]|jgi:NAD(P)-dependent dehydrogenase (short-subunit alcohol dehydrogenase family)|nr:SDR family oxidoreductase [Thermoanaerobaculia bacterium]
MPAPAQVESRRRGAVVVTGASSGIGEACALHLDRAGFEVFAGVRRDLDAAALCSKAPGPLRTLLLDVTDGASIARAADAVLETVGDRGVAGLVNNAGVVIPGVLEFLDLDSLRHQLEVNVVGQVAVTKAFVSALRRARGRVVNIGSISGRVALPFVGPYSASKFALEALNDSLRLELHAWGIDVSLVEPGSVETRLWEKSDTSADEVVSTLSKDALALYGKAIAAVRATSRRFEERGVPPIRVARAVEHALTARRPKTRYLVGRDARAQAFARWLLPDRLLDAVLRREIRRSAARAEARSRL